MRRVAVAVVLLVVAGGLALRPAGAGARAVARCHVGQVSASLRAGSPGAGQRFAILTLRNRSRHTCRVFGYAGVQLLDARRHAVATRVVRDRARPPRTRVLRPGRHTRALLHWTVIPSPGEPQSGRCEPDPRWVEVTPPDERRHLVIRWRLGPVCGDGRIDLTPFGRIVR